MANSIPLSVTNSLIHDSFGMITLGRSWEVGTEYRYGFDGKEKQKEFFNEGIIFKYRIENPAIGRFFSIDPLASQYPYNSPYAFCENSVIAFIELEGLEKFYAPNGTFLGQIGSDNSIHVFTAKNLEEGKKWVNNAIYTEKEGRAQATSWNTGIANSLSVTMTENLFKSVVDKTLLGTIAEGMLSQTFYQLILAMPENIKIDSKANATFTKPNGDINIGKSETTDKKILGLTWEMTNNANIKRLNMHRSNLEQTKKEFVIGILKIEAEALLNMALVANELGIADATSQAFTSDLNRLNNGEITTDQMTDIIANWAYENGMIIIDGKEKLARDVYGGQYDAAKKSK